MFGRVLNMSLVVQHECDERMMTVKARVVVHDETSFEYISIFADLKNKAVS